MLPSRWRISWVSNHISPKFAIYWEVWYMNLSCSFRNFTLQKHKCLLYTVRCRYNATSFSPQSQTVIYTLPQSMQGCMQYHVILGRIIRVLTVCHIWMNKYIPAVAHIIFYLNKLQFLHKIHIDDKKITHALISVYYLKQCGLILNWAPKDFHMTRIPLTHFQ